MGIFIAIAGIALIMVFQIAVLPYVVTAAVPAALYLWVAAKVFDSWVGTKFFIIHALVGVAIFAGTMYVFFMGSSLHKRLSLVGYLSASV